MRADFIEFTVDRSPHKQGCYLPGTHIPILHPDRIREARPDYLLILPWNLKEEIVQQTGYIREWGGQFVVPIPEGRCSLIFSRHRSPEPTRRAQKRRRPGFSSRLVLPRGVEDNGMDPSIAQSNTR